MIGFAPVHPHLENEPLTVGAGIKIIPDLGEIKMSPFLHQDEGNNKNEKYGTKLTKEQLWITQNSFWSWNPLV